MTAAVQDDAKWDEVMWVRTLLFVGAALLLVNSVVFMVNARAWAAALDATLAPFAAAAAALMTRRDDYGWWLALAVLSASVALSIGMAIATWAIAELLGSWLSLAMLWALRRPPPFPRRPTD